MRTQETEAATVPTAKATIQGLHQPGDLSTPLLGNERLLFLPSQVFREALELNEIRDSKVEELRQVGCQQVRHG